MKVIFLIGGTASGKSLAGAQLQALGAERIDLDQVSRAVLSKEPQCVAELVEAFGPEILAEESSWPSEASLEYEAIIDRAKLARRAFGSSEDTRLLESIEMPYIKAHLADLLTPVCCAAPGPKVMVVEVPLPDRIEDLLPLADTILYIRTPLARRRQLAQGRGMAAQDFDERIAHQPSDAWCVHHASAIIDNDGTAEELCAKVTKWYETWLKESSDTPVLTNSQESLESERQTGTPTFDGATISSCESEMREKEAQE